MSSTGQSLRIDLSDFILADEQDRQIQKIQEKLRELTRGGWRFANISGAEDALEWVLRDVFRVTPWGGD